MIKMVKDFSGEIKKIFNSRYLEQYPSRKEIKVTVIGRDLTFDNLKKLSNLLGTKDINIFVEDDGKCHTNHGDGYCYCDGEGEISIHCEKVKF